MPTLNDIDTDARDETPDEDAELDRAALEEAAWAAQLADAFADNGVM